VASDPSEGLVAPVMNQFPKCVDGRNEFGFRKLSRTIPISRSRSDRIETRGKRKALEQVALAWARAARVSTDERRLAAWRNAVDAGGNALSPQSFAYSRYPLPFTPRWINLPHSLLKFTQTEIFLTWECEVANVEVANVLEGLRLGRNLALPNFNGLLTWNDCQYISLSCWTQ